MYLNLETEGRPLDTNVELWQGPNRVAHKMRVWSEDGRLRPFSAVVQAPRDGYGSTILYLIVKLHLVSRNFFFKNGASFEWCETSD